MWLISAYQEGTFNISYFEGLVASAEMCDNVTIYIFSKAVGSMRYVKFNQKTTLLHIMHLYVLLVFCIDERW